MSSADAYRAAFQAARYLEYPAIDAIERKYDHKINRDRLESAARILACPLKDNPPHWQHGRVIYAVTRAYLSGRLAQPITLLDVGTAKGFSALCLQWALNDSPLNQYGAVVSVDVLDPLGTERRNSVLECDGPKTLAQFLEPWPEAQRITFVKSTGVEWLKRHPARVNVAFLDGKHKGEEVFKEGKLLAEHQERGDLAIFDDVQMDGVALAVEGLRKWFDAEIVPCCRYRTYAIGVRR